MKVGGDLLGQRAVVEKLGNPTVPAAAVAGSGAGKMVSAVRAA
jgi:hypothetical protein